MEKQLVPPVFRIQGLRHCVAGRCVLAIESLDIEAGPICSVVGHNGAGKTTLLRLLAGLDKPAEGTIVSTAQSGEVILSFQRPFLFLGTVQSNISYGMKLRCVPWSPDGLSEMIDRMGLGDLLHRDARALSAGEMQRVALARALACCPRVLLLDEPTANLDSQSVGAIENEIRRFYASGGTVIVATHVLESVYRLGGRVVGLEQGNLVEPELTITK